MNSKNSILQNFKFGVIRIFYAGAESCNTWIILYSNATPASESYVGAKQNIQSLDKAHFVV